MKKLLYIIGGGKTLRRLKPTSCTLNNLPLSIAIIATIALTLSACERVDYGEWEDGEATRTSVNQADSTSVSDGDSCTLDVYIQGVEWEDNDTINY